MGLNPRTPGSHPEPKADTQLLSHSGAPIIHILFFKKILFIHERHREREREAETQAEGEAGSMQGVPDVELDPGSPGSRPGPKAALNR